MKEEEKALLSFNDKDGNPREIYNKDLTDRVRPLVEEIQQRFKSRDKNLCLNIQRCSQNCASHGVYS